MAPTRKPAAKPASGGSVNFGDDSFYVSGGQFDLPEGKYAVEFNTAIHAYKKGDGSTGKPFLAVVATFYPLAGGDPIEKPFSCGSKSMLSFVPSADGKGFDAIPGGTGKSMSGMTDWNIFRESLKNCGLPAGLLQNDLTVIDGIWVSTVNEPEPAERKQMGSRTGEAAGDPAAKVFNNNICKVVEILDEGKPWEGTGGFDFKPVAEEAPKATKIAPKVGPKAVVGKVAPAPVEEETEEAESPEAAAVAGVSAHLLKEANSDGCTKLSLRAGTFAYVGEKFGDDMAQAVIDTYFATDKALNSILAPLGYVVKGPHIKVSE